MRLTFMVWIFEICWRIQQSTSLKGIRKVGHWRTHSDRISELLPVVIANFKRLTFAWHLTHMLSATAAGATYWHIQNKTLYLISSIIYHSLEKHNNREKVTAGEEGNSMKFLKSYKCILDFTALSVSKDFHISRYQVDIWLDTGIPDGGHI